MKRPRIQGQRILVLCFASAASILMAQEPAPTPTVLPLTRGEEIAVARLKEIRAIGTAFQAYTWNDFDPSSFPSVIFEPNAWAIAVGFDQPPPGFRLVEGATDGVRPVFRAAPGSLSAMTNLTHSLSRVNGTWAVVMKIDPPEIAPDGSYLGRAPTEEAIARFIGDAFLLHLMKLRGMNEPYVVGAADYPDSPELIALTQVEQRLLLRSITIRNISLNLDQFKDLARQVAAVQRARWQLLGPELAAIEKQIEGWDGLRQYAMALVYRHAISGAFESAKIESVDAAFGSYADALFNRQLLTNYPIRHMPEAVAGTHAQVVSRASALTFMLEWMVFPEWKTRALKGDLALTDLVAEKLGLQPEEEPGLLEAAKQAAGYDVSLRQAKADLAWVGLKREQGLGQALSGKGDLLTIKLNGKKVLRYRDDPLSTRHFGQGRLTHPGGLELRTDVLELEVLGLDGGEAPPVLTRAGASRADLYEITMRVPADARPRLGSKALKTNKIDGISLTQASSFQIEASGLRLHATAGTLSRAPAGDWEISLQEKGLGD